MSVRVKRGIILSKFEMIRCGNKWVKPLETAKKKAVTRILQINVIKDSAVTSREDMLAEADAIICELFAQSLENHPEYVYEQNIQYLVNIMPLRLRDRINEINGIRYNYYLWKKYHNLQKNRNNRDIQWDPFTQIDLPAASKFTIELNQLYENYAVEGYLIEGEHTDQITEVESNYTYEDFSGGNYLFEGEIKEVKSKLDYQDPGNIIQYKYVYHLQTLGYDESLNTGTHSSAEDEYFATSEKDYRLRCHFKKLPKNVSVVMELGYIYGLDIREVSEKTNLEPGTIYRYRGRAYRKLKKIKNIQNYFENY